MAHPELDRDELCSILSLYHLDGLEEFGDLPSTSGTTTYWAKVGGRRYLLRFTGRRSFADMVFDRELLTHLRSLGLPVPRVIENVANGSFTPWNSRGHYVSIYEDVGGRRLGVFELRTRHAKAIGDFLGRLHRASDTFEATRKNPVDLEKLGATFARILRRAAKGELLREHGAAIALLGQELAEQERRKVRGPLGVVHGDLFVGNARFHQDELAVVLDFELACTERFTWDLASTINAWCWEPSPAQQGGPAGAYSARKLRGLLTAYQAVRPLGAVELEELPQDLRLLALRTALVRFADFELSKKRQKGLYRDYRHFLARLSVLAEGRAEALIERAIKSPTK
ncbi:MAG: phosphotransferase [Myxococcota bacterium]